MSRSQTLLSTYLRRYMKGTSVAVDTACSSSLVAAHISRGLIIDGGAVNTVGAIAAGASLILAPHVTGVLAAAGMLSADGRCKTLDTAADGYVRSEAVWALPLWSTETPAPAVRAAAALLLSSAVNQDGRSSSLTAPNGPSQQVVLAAAARGALPTLHIPPDRLEMHGTGTALGDPIEFGAAVAVHSAAHGAAGGDGGGPAPPSLALSAIKSAFGHSEAAAGAWGLLAAAAQLQRRGGGQLPHLRTLNPFVTQVLDRGRHGAGAGGRPAAAARRQDRAAGSAGLSLAVSGVSSFAFQGTNAHGLLGEAGGAAVGGGGALDRRSGLLDRRRLWCSAMPPPLLNRCLGVDAHVGGGGGGVATFEPDLAVPRYAHLAELSVLGHRVVPAAVAMGIAAAAARLAMSPMDAGPEAPLHCARIALLAVGRGGASARMRVEVDQRGAIVITADVDVEPAGGRPVGARLLTCIAATSWCAPSGDGESAASRRRHPPADAAALATSLFASFTGGGSAAEHGAVSSYAVARRGCSGGDGQLCAVGIVPLLFAGAGAGNPATLAAVAAAWLPDLADDDIDALGGGSIGGGGDAIQTRRSASASGGSDTATAACGAWTLSGARTHAITRALVAAEVAPPTPTPPHLQPGEVGVMEIEEVAGGPQTPLPLSTGANNKVALRLLSWVAATSTYWRPPARAPARASVGADVEEEDESGMKEAAAAEEAATLRRVLVVLNTAPRADDDPVGRHTNLMEAGLRHHLLCVPRNAPHRKLSFIELNDTSLRGMCVSLGPRKRLGSTLSRWGQVKHARHVIPCIVNPFILY